MSILEPQIVLLENVRGFTLDFKARVDGSATMNYSEMLESELQDKYILSTAILRASRYGIPQSRPRFFLIGFQRSRPDFYFEADPFRELDKLRLDFLARRGMSARASSRSAISDLEVKRNGTVGCKDSPGYEAIAYKRPRTQFQKAMRDGHHGLPTDTRLAKHQPNIAHRFKRIIAQCKAENRLNVQLSREMRDRFGISKIAMRVLDPSKPAPTITSMPDDLLHYSEGRTLTVRENARLQTFPDWFVFKGKYTTGGDKRRREVPRFTQVANAVPPLLAEMLGEVLSRYVAQPTATQE